MVSGIQAAPAPWKLEGRTWVFFLPGLSKTSSFPAGFSVPYQADTLVAGGEFIGGLGTVQIVSYYESPVGPYDELIYVPGRWKYSDGSRGFRVTRIYVSTKESTENGRRNWNIPKQVAEFKISTQDRVTTIAVSHPGEPSPFFKASVKPVPILSKIPIPLDTRLLGSYYSLVQPPLPSGVNHEEVATEKWVALTPVMTGSTRLVSITPLLDGKVGDGVGFPAVVPWSIGGYTEPLNLEFGLAKFSDSV